MNVFFSHMNEYQQYVQPYVNAVETWVKVRRHSRIQVWFPSSANEQLSKEWMKPPPPTWHPILLIDPCTCYSPHLSVCPDVAHQCLIISAFPPLYKLWSVSSDVRVFQEPDTLKLDVLSNRLSLNGTSWRTARGRTWNGQEKENKHIAYIFIYLCVSGCLLYP